ncbi:MAG TPA: hypothetical protein VMT34_04590, partial [Aggregatilineales bacterium]|nr:hypothetical protein [Aggregatilineales bacterium]
YPYRRIGHDLEVIGATYVPLMLDLSACVRPDYLRAQVEAALRDRFSNRALPGGKRGFFHPDNLTFGAGIAISQLVALAQSTPGVESVTALTLATPALTYQWPPDAATPARDVIARFGALDIPRLDNDPDFPDNGLLTLTLKGGR